MRHIDGQFINSQKFADLQVTVNISQLIDQFNSLIHQQIPQIYIQCRIDNKPIKKITKICRKTNFDQEIVFPYKYKQIMPTSQLFLTIWSMSNINGPLAGTSINFYDDNLIMKTGKYNIKLWPGQIADNNTKGLIDDNRLIELNNSYKRQEILNNAHKMRYNNKNDNINPKGIQLLKKKQIYDYKSIPYAFLLIQFPFISRPVIYFDQLSVNQQQINKTNYTSIQQVLVLNDHDFTNKLQDPIKKTIYQLARQQKDTKIKPTKIDLQKMKLLANKPSHRQRSLQQKNLFFRFRFYLVQNNLHFISLVLSINWQKNDQAEQGLQLINRYQKIQTQDLLNLLSSSFIANNHYHQKIKGSYSIINQIRRFAVKNLMIKTNVQIENILLQLVQALRYQDQQGDLHSFLIDKACQSKQIYNSLYWYLKVESIPEDKSEKKNKDVKKLEISQKFQKIFNQLNINISQKQKSMMERQQKFKNQLSKISKIIKQMKATKQVKVAQLRSKLSSLKIKEPIQFSLNPNILLNQCIPQKCTIFSSAMAPMLLTFNTQSNGIIQFIYKNGDDLRQDQLVMQIFRLMDSKLKNIKQDFRVVTYKILALSRQEGFLQFVPNTSTVQHITKINKTPLVEFLRKLSQDQNNPMYKSINEKMDLQKSTKQDCFQQILKNYLLSCAGCCSITYFIGIGDRHLQNLLIDNKGLFMHIDFGFILGKDPKAFATPIKIFHQMIQPMTAAGKQIQFFSKCLDSFLYLRKYSKLFISIIEVMIHSGIKDLTKQSLQGFCQRFHIDKNDTDAQIQFLTIMGSCLKAFIGNYINDNLHLLASKLRQ